MTYSLFPNERRQHLQQRIARGRYIPHDTAARHISVPKVDSISPPPTPSITTHQQPQAIPASAPVKRTLFSSIIDASVQVEKVTRQSVRTVQHTFEPPHLASLRTRRQKLFVRTFYAVGSASFLIAIGLGVTMMLQSGTQKPVNSTSVLGTTTQNDANRNSELPTENIPTTQDIATYLVAPPYPRYLRIPSLHIDARIRRLGLDSKGAIATPNNINDVGWYDASVKPGEEEGASIIEGHIAGPTKHGVFWDLNKIAYNDTIIIEKGSGEQVKYAVTRTERVPSNQLEMKTYLNPETPGKHDLKLISAPGKFNIISGVYDTRIVVYAKEIPAK